MNDSRSSNIDNSIFYASIYFMRKFGLSANELERDPNRRNTQVLTYFIHKSTGRKFVHDSTVYQRNDPYQQWTEIKL